jgi:hypothetical protein
MKDGMPPLPLGQPMPTNILVSNDEPHVVRMRAPLVDGASSEYNT